MQPSRGFHQCEYFNPTTLDVYLRSWLLCTWLYSDRFEVQSTCKYNFQGPCTHGSPVSPSMQICQLRSLFSIRIPSWRALLPGIPCPVRDHLFLCNSPRRDIHPLDLALAWLVWESIITFADEYDYIWRSVQNPQACFKSISLWLLSS